MSLYLACTALNPQHRPTAFELMETIEECVAEAGQPRTSLPLKASPTTLNAVQTLASAMQ